jgi:hypothetical protein
MRSHQKLIPAAFLKDHLYCLHIIIIIIIMTIRIGVDGSVLFFLLETCFLQEAVFQLLL